MLHLDLIAGDALELLPGIAADVVITDPVWPNCPPGLIAGADDPDGLWAKTMHALPASIGRLIVILRHDCDPRFLRHVPDRLPFFRTVNLPYALPGYIGRKLGGDEAAFWFGSPVASVPGRRVIPGRAPSAQPADRPSNGHPCSRAQVHMDWLVWWGADAGETVCDPFMGSGSTGVACAKLGRGFVGIDIEPRFVALAEERIRAAQNQGQLFVEAAPCS